LTDDDIEGYDVVTTSICINQQRHRDTQTRTQRLTDGHRRRQTDEWVERDSQPFSLRLYISWRRTWDELSSVFIHKALSPRL